VLGALFGKLADRMKKSTLVVIGLFIFSMAGALLGFNFNLLFLLLGFIATAGDELSNVSLWAWLDTLDKDHAQDGLVNGAINFFGDLGWTIGPVTAGLLFGVIGPFGVILTGASFLFLAWLAALVLLQHPSAQHVGRGDIYAHSPRRYTHKK
jgi:MFS family permease